MTHDISDDARPDTGPEGTHTGRRAFMAGAAGLAAGAAVLGTGSPAGAIGTTQPWTIPLKWIDMTDGSLTAVGLGTGGVAQAYLSAFGDMAAMTVRIKMGAGATPGDGPWVIDGADMPSGFVPIEGPTDITDVGTSLWFGTGQALNFANTFQNAAHVNCSWVNFAAANGPVSAHIWALPDKHNDGSGNVMFNYAGGSPFGVPNGEGTILYSSIVYLVNLPEPE